MSITFAQENTCIEKDSYQRLSRFRLSLGYVDLLSNYDEFRYPFINLSYRSSGFDRSSYNVKVDLAFELGINTLIITYKHSDDYNVYFLPYAKFGPEIRLYRNLFIAGCAGLALATYDLNFAPAPFLGLNGFYLFELNNKLSLELESGIHTTFGWPLLFYITIGISVI
ncbi:MAG: hypothetical protein HS131_10135 [Ignavibacteriales bacterium]|nr:hypothetical protein [Ignavibacteriales bacterium]